MGGTAPIVVEKIHCNVSKSLQDMCVKAPLPLQSPSAQMPAHWCAALRKIRMVAGSQASKADFLHGASLLVLAATARAVLVQ